MQTTKKTRKHKNGKLYLTPKQVAVLHIALQEFADIGGVNLLNDEQAKAFENVTEKVERVRDYCDTANSL